MSKRCAAQICPTGTDCALFYPHGLFLAAQMSDKSDKSDRSDIKPPPHSGCHTVAVIPHVPHDRSELITRAAQKLLYLAGIAVRRDIFPIGIDCVLFFIFTV